MGQDPNDCGIDVDAIDQEVDARLAKVKMPAREKDSKVDADE